MKCQDCEKQKQRMREMEEEFSIMHDIKLASLILVLVVALVILMAFFM